MVKRQTLTPFTSEVKDMASKFLGGQKTGALLILGLLRHRPIAGRASRISPNLAVAQPRIICPVLDPGHRRPG